MDLKVTTAKGGYSVNSGNQASSVAQARPNAPVPVIQSAPANLSVAKPQQLPNLSVARLTTPNVSPFRWEQTVDVRIDPTRDNAIVIDAPDYFLESDEWNNNLKPLFDQLDGKNITDEQLNTLLDGDTKSYLQNTSNTVRERMKAIENVKYEIDKDMSNDDAMLALRNVSAGYQKDDDQTTHIVTGVGKDGEEATMTVGAAVNDFKGMNDSQRAEFVKTYQEIIQDKTKTAKQRAAAYGMLGFMRQKGFTNASGLTQVNRALDRITESLSRGPIGAVGTFITDKVGGQGDLETVTKKRLQSAIGYLDGIESADNVGGFIGEGLSLGRDWVLSAATGGTVAPALAATRAGKAIQTSRAVNALRSVGASGGVTGKAISFAGSRLREVPEELIMAATMTARNPEINTLKEFAEGMAINSLVTGVGGAALRNAANFSPNTFRKGAELNAQISEVITRGQQRLTDLPGIRHIKTVTDGLVDSMNPIRRKANAHRLIESSKGIGTATDRANYQKQFENALASRSDSGQNFASEFLNKDGDLWGMSGVRGAGKEYREIIKLENAVDIMGDSDPSWAADLRQYINDRAILQNIENGRGSYSKAEQARVRDSVAKFADDQDAQDMWQAYDDFYRRVEDWRESAGISDADINAMLRDTTFRDGYVHLAKQIDPENWKKFYKPKELKKIEAHFKTMGADGTELVDPFKAATDYAYATGKLISENNFNRYIGRDFVGSGAVGGRILSTPQQTKELASMKNAFKNEKASLGELMNKEAQDIATTIARAVDDMEDIYNPAAASELATLIDSSIDDLAEGILSKKGFDDIISKVKDDIGDAYNPDYIAALETLAHYRKKVEDSVMNGLNKPLSGEQAGEVMDMWRDRLTEKIRLNRAQARGDIVEAVDELGDTFRRAPESISEVGDGRIPSPTTAFRERQDAWKKLNESMGQYDPSKPNIITWYEDGHRGAAEINDAETLRWMNKKTKSQLEQTLFRDMSEFTARIFRYGTTGGSPAFNFFRNPVRDTLTATMGVGAEFLSPERTMDMLIRSGLPREQAEAALDSLRRSYQGTSRGTFLQTEPNAATMAMRDIRRTDAARPNEKIVAAWDNFTDASGTRQKLGDFANKVDSVMNFSEPLVRDRVGAIAYAQALARGESENVAEQWATWAAREVTTNFRNKGDWLKSIGNSVPYLTAAINGPASFLRVAKADPLGVGSRMMTGITLPTMLITYSNLQNEDDAAAYLDIPEWERRNNLIVMLGGGDILKVPIPHEVQPIIGALQDVVERQYGADKSNFDILADAILGSSPIDLSGFSEKKALDEGGLNISMGISRLTGQLAPQILRAPIELAANRNLYTGQKLRMSDEELIERGLVDPNSDISESDRSLAGWNSSLLGSIADKVGVDQYILQNIVRNYGGQVGEQLIGTVDSFGEASTKNKKGKNFADAIAKAMFGKSYSVAESDYWRGFNGLQSKKDTVATKIEKLNVQAAQGADEYEISKQIDALKTTFGEEVAQFANQYGKMYQMVGGMNPKQTTSLVNLLTFYPSRTATAGSWEAGVDNEAAMAARNAGQQLAVRSGLPDSNERDRYGRLVEDELGDLGVDFGNTSMSARVAQSRYYDAPKQAAYEFEQIFKADKSAGLPKLDTLKKPYQERLDELFAQAKNLKGAAATAVYNQINAIQEEYMTNVFDQRIRPLIDKWGPGILTNRSVVDEMSKHIMIPGDFTPFFSRKKTPYLTKDTVAYIRDRYGVGNTNQTNLPIGRAAERRIEQINADINNGRMAAAQFKLTDLEDDIEAGNEWVNHDIMNSIKQQLSNRRRR